MLEWLIFVSATLGTAFGGRRAVQGWLYDRAARREARRADLAGWSAGGVDTWTVHLAGPDTDPAAVVTLVTSSPEQAARLRRYLEEHEYLSRNPTPAELEALDAAARGDTAPVPRRRRLWPFPRRVGA
jgi:acylphosphatase